MAKVRKHIALFCYLFFYCLANLPFLTSFPLIHSDESWLGGLSRHMLITGSVSVTEPFFTAKPRFQHTFKTLFHLLQEAAIAAGGYTPFALRCLSLFMGIAVILVFYFTAFRLFSRRSIAFACALLLSADIQFIYACHFARSEIMILLLLCLCLLVLTRPMPNGKAAAACALFTGIALLIHPNAFFLACCCGCIFLADAMLRKGSLKPLGLYCLLTGFYALLAVAGSYRMSPNFLSRYFAYGASDFDLAASPGTKLTDLFGFFSRLWNRQSGTYYLPDIRPQLALGLACCILCVFFALTMHREQPQFSRRCLLLVAAQAGLVGSIALVGRLNQTSIVFLLPAFYLLLACTIQIFTEKKAVPVLASLALLSFLWSGVQILPVAEGASYREYTGQIREFVPSDAKTIANLNTGFYFDDDALLDYRNLPYAEDAAGVADFCISSGVEYILYSDELDYIYDHRPYFNVIYGNPMFVEELRRFCREECTPVGEFYNARYGKRINALAEDSRYGHVTVYKVDRPS